MSLTDKLFSLLGFAKPLPLKRCNGSNLLPNKVLVLSINGKLNSPIKNGLTQLSANLIENIEKIEEKSLEALVVDATDYIDETNYQQLYLRVQQSLRLLTHNARVLVIANTPTDTQTAEQNAFSQAIVGFTKSLAKEIGRKGSTANVLFIEKDENVQNTGTALVNPIQFFLSAKSAFVSGQVLTVDNTEKCIDSPSTATKHQRVAVVTGAAQGIGAAIAHQLADENYLVIGVDIEPMQQQLIETMRAIQGESFILDVSASDAGEQLAKLAAEHNGFDLIVHNAGITRDKTLAKMPKHFWQQTIDINLLSVIRINKTLREHKAINTGASIVCLSSMNGIAGQGGQTNYACSKAGIMGYVASMHNELKLDNITINAVAPGFIETQMTAKIPFFTREMGRRISALGQGGLPNDVAQTVAFLGNHTSYAISGQTLRVCGLNIIGA